MSEKIVGVLAQNSTEYINAVFDTLNSGLGCVNLRAKDDERLKALAVDNILEPGQSSGWYTGSRYVPSTSSDTAQVLFTSGTEGAPKGVFLSHSALANTTERIVSVMEIDSTIREYIGVPVYYSFGFGRCRAISSAGGEFYIPERGFDPLEIVSMLNSGQINAISAVPTLWRLVLQAPELFEGAGPKVKWIEIGSQYMSQAEKESLKAIFPNAIIVQHYGLTEASRTTFLRIDKETGPALESVGKCVGSCQVGISYAGRIKIRGPHLASKLLSDDFYSLVGDDGWFETNDLGREENGFLYYEGRADDQINCSGVKLSPDILESRLADVLGSANGLSITGIPDPLRGQVVLVGFEQGCGIAADDIKKAMVGILREFAVDGNSCLKLWCCGESLPKTATGKVQRRSLSQQYIDVQKSDNHLAVQSSGEDMKSQLIQIWENALGISPISPSCSFYDLGGDSLSSISVALKMERVGIPKDVCRSIFEGRTIDEISEHIAGDRGESESDERSARNLPKCINFARGILVLFVIAAHWMPGVVERLPDFLAKQNKFLSSVYSFGTPGFAVIFGVGAGFFYLSRYVASPESFFNLVKRNAFILVSGMVLLAGLRLISIWMSEGTVPGLTVAGCFYSVIAYYLLVILSFPLWFKLLSYFKFSTFSILVSSLTLLYIKVIIEEVGILPSENPVLQYLILQLTAKYNYFDMSAGMLIGLALGNWLRTAPNINIVKPLLMRYGFLMMVFAVLLSYEMGSIDLWLAWPKPMTIWTWVFYAGLTFMLLRASIYLVTDLQSKYSKVLVNIMSCIGVLAFPLFISHELVLPMTSIFKSLGAPFPVVVPMLAFLGFMYFSIKKIYGIYYAA